MRDSDTMNKLSSDGINNHREVISSQLTGIRVRSIEIPNQYYEEHHSEWYCSKAERPHYKLVPSSSAYYWIKNGPY